jgi:hypothetical protein
MPKFSIMHFFFEEMMSEGNSENNQSGLVEEYSPDRF